MSSYTERIIEETIADESGYVRGNGELTRDEIDRFRCYRLKKIVNYAVRNSELYKERLCSAGGINSIEDIRKLPFTTASDLRHRPYKMMCITMGGVVRTFAHFTTGTTGMPKRIMFSESDISRIRRNMRGVIGEMLTDAGLDPKGSHLGIYLPDVGRPLSMAGMIAEAGEDLGCTSYKGSCADIAEEQLTEIETEKPDVLMGSAFRIWRIVKSGIETERLSGLDVKAILITSEYMPQAMRKEIEKAFGAEVFHHYGMTEPGFAIGVECGRHAGYHYNEADLLFEIVDPVTGENLPDGHEGELVLTTLNRQAQPLIRYRTGDIASITHDPCCGALSSIGLLTKRIGLTYELKNGKEIYSSVTDEALYCLEDMLDYRIYLSDESGIDHLRCEAECIGDKESFDERVKEALMGIEAIKDAVCSGALTIDPLVIRGRGDLRRGGRTMKRKIVDERATAGMEEPVLDLA